MVRRCAVKTQTQDHQRTWRQGWQARVARQATSRRACPIRQMGRADQVCGRPEALFQMMQLLTSAMQARRAPQRCNEVRNLKREEFFYLYT